MAETPQPPLLPEPKRHQSNPTAAGRPGVRVCGVLNIIVGCVVGCAGGLGVLWFLVLMMVYPGDTWWLLTLPAAVLLAGILSISSGACLLESSECVPSVALIPLALATVVALSLFVYVAYMERFDFLLNAAGLLGLLPLLGIVELFYLWRQRSVK